MSPKSATNRTNTDLKIYKRIEEEKKKGNHSNIDLNDTCTHINIEAMLHQFFIKISKPGNAGLGGLVN